MWPQKSFNKILVYKLSRLALARTASEFSARQISRKAHRDDWREDGEATFRQMKK